MVFLFCFVDLSMLSSEQVFWGGELILAVGSGDKVRDGNCLGRGGRGQN